MATVETGRMTAEEFWAWAQRPENADRRCELLDGQVVDVPWPGSERHGTVCGLVICVLGEYLFGKRRGHVCGNNTGLVVARDPDTVLGPDILAFVGPTRALSSWFVDRVPNLIVEVVSANDTADGISDRVRRYLRLGVPLVWVIDSEVRTVTAYRFGCEMHVLDEADELAGDDAPPEFRCRVADLFTLPSPPAAPGGPSA